jgi:hypothetical protein
MNVVKQALFFYINYSKIFLINIGRKKKEAPYLFNLDDVRVMPTAVHRTVVNAHTNRSMTRASSTSKSKKITLLLANTDQSSSS